MAWQRKNPFSLFFTFIVVLILFTTLLLSSSVASASTINPSREETHLGIVEDVNELLKYYFGELEDFIDDALAPITNTLSWIGTQINLIWMELRQLPEKIVETFMEIPELAIETTRDAFLFVINSFERFFTIQKNAIASWVGPAVFVSPLAIVLVAIEMLLIFYVLLFVYDRIPFVG